MNVGTFRGERKERFGRWMARLTGSSRHFTAERTTQFGFSPDGSQIAFEREHTESDAVLLRDVTR